MSAVWWRAWWSRLQMEYLTVGDEEVRAAIEPDLE
jgi:hypothetical protein